MSGQLIPVNAVTLSRYERAGQELAVSSYLEQARNWLATAVEHTGPEQVAAAKAQIATAAEATKQLGLSKEIQLDAQEMVRRAEYALGKAIRKGQEEGAITVIGSKPNGHSEYTRVRNGRVEHMNGRVPDENASIASPTDFLPHAQERHDVYTMTGDVAPEQFDAAIDAAKAEGNLSRANVVRKIKGAPATETRESRAARIAELASQGYTSHQIAKEVGLHRSTVAEIAHDFDITITADVVRGKVRRFDHNRVLDNVTEALEVAAMSLRDVDPAQLDEDEALERLDSLTTSINALSKAVKKIKESFRD